MNDPHRDLVLFPPDDVKVCYLLILFFTSFSLFPFSVCIYYFKPLNVLNHLFKPSFFYLILVLDGILSERNRVFKRAPTYRV